LRILKTDVFVPQNKAGLWEDCSSWTICPQRFPGHSEAEILDLSGTIFFEKMPQPTFGSGSQAGAAQRESDGTNSSI
jgi:hypothetical protein